jgi:hypothetical protein
MTEPKKEAEQKHEPKLRNDASEVLESSSSDSEELSEEDLEAIAGGLGDKGNLG